MTKKWEKIYPYGLYLTSCPSKFWEHALFFSVVDPNPYTLARSDPDPEKESDLIDINICRIFVNFCSEVVEIVFDYMHIA